MKGGAILKDCRWIGYTDIHWLCSLVNNEQSSVTSYQDLGRATYLLSSSGLDSVLKKDNEISKTYSVFIGPKEAKLLRTYRDELNIEKFEMNIDFGWFFFLTRPLLFVLDCLQEIFSNMGIVILLLTILFKILTYPMTRKSCVSIAKMKKIQPKIASIQKMYSYDKLRLNQELIALYKQEGVSPLSGCLPLLLQAPIFFCLYKVFFISIKMRHAPLFGWIHDLSASDPCYLFNLFGFINFDLPSFLRIGIWPIIMGVTMFVQQKMTSAARDDNTALTQEAKIQRNMMLFLPVLFTYVCSSFPVGVVVYWTISNVIGYLQQRYVTATVLKRGT
jgi:YidC/Oxa1 family membrane protein insertase